MKILIWSLCIVLLALWTGGILLAVGISGWLAEALASGRAGELGALAAQWPLPAWLSPWVDPALLQSIRAMLGAALDGFDRGAPWLASMIGWLVPLLWVVWALGSLLLLLLAGTGHFIVAMFRGKPAARA